MKTWHIIISVFVLSWFSTTNVSAKDAKTEATSPIIFKSIVYFYPDSKLPTQSQLKKQLKNFTTVDELPETIDNPIVSFSLLDDFADTYPVPNHEYLRYAGRGLSKSQAEDIQSSKHILVLNVAYTKTNFLENYKAVNDFLYGIATTHKGLIWDSETRELFTPEFWKEKRLAPYKDIFPNVANHITIHAYNNGDDNGIRAITLGMAKFGSPDIVVNNFSWSLSEPMGNLINLASQSLLEGLSPSKNGTLTLNINRLQNESIRQQLLQDIKENASTELEVSIGEGKPEDGDPHNFLLEILFDKVEGKSLSEKQDKTLSALFGWEDSIALVKHDTEILNASSRAKAKLNGLRKDFKSGLEPGEFILLKAPFKTKSGENEWMWVEVISWNKTDIEGILKNEPYHVPELRAGSEVAIDQNDVFDYIRNFANGTSEGNETGKLMAANKR